MHWYWPSQNPAREFWLLEFFWEQGIIWGRSRSCNRSGQTHISGIAGISSHWPVKESLIPHSPPDPICPCLPHLLPILSYLTPKQPHSLFIAAPPRSYAELTWSSLHSNSKWHMEESSSHPIGTQSTYWHTKPVTRLLWKHTLEKRTFRWNVFSYGSDHQCLWRSSWLPSYIFIRSSS